MRAIGRSGVSVLTLMMLVGAWSLAARQVSGLELRPGVEVFAHDPAQRRLAEWAVARFERAGLRPPKVEIAFHADASGCGGHLGYAKDGHVDVCTVLVNEMARRNLLHEMGHVWIDQNVSLPVRERFLELRGLRAWNVSSVPWDERGYEQGAEIIAWTLGTRILTAQIPGNDSGSIEEAYELLTGISTPEP